MILNKGSKSIYILANYFFEVFLNCQVLLKLVTKKGL